MIIEDKIVVKNYKCFDDEGGGFERIMPLNVIIGKNNSGKSTLIDLVEYIQYGDGPIAYTGRINGNLPEVIVTHSISEKEHSKILEESVTNRDNMLLGDYSDYGIDFKNNIFKYIFSGGDKKISSKSTSDIYPDTQQIIDSVKNRIPKSFTNKLFCKIAAERDIVREKSSIEDKFVLQPNGVNATNAIQQLINRTSLIRHNLIEKKLLEELNLIINPDIIFTRILVQNNDNDYWEIFFEDANKNRIALSKMGSGIKTVLLVLLNLIIRPEYKEESKATYIFAFEELENNLHPSLQRRLYNYIIEYSKKHSAYFFITTHSNIVIDIFGANENAQIIHVENDGVRSKTTTVLSTKETKHILHDLGIKASDLLQCNGVIWVEGPSDRNYIYKWLEILDPDLKEGLHYSIMFYGGRLLANLSFDSESFNKEVIPLLKINRNAFVIIDRDGKITSPKLNDTKRRINLEIGDDHCWITEGREIENYLSDEVVTNWLLGRHGTNVQFVNDKNTKLEDNIRNSTKKNIVTYNSSKTLYSSEISEFIDPDSLNIMDLKNRLTRLVEVIREWNRM
ncbi:MAG: AAA family ATPase [Ignavibacteria bacterium]|nr:AAA family ATPase [Ignavibacteria bacterium]